MSFIERRKARLQNNLKRIAQHYSDMSNIERMLVDNKDHFVYKNNIANGLGLSDDINRFNIHELFDNEFYQLVENIYNYLFLLYTKNNVEISDVASLKKRSFILALKSLINVKDEDIYKYVRVYDSMMTKLESLIYLKDLIPLNVRNVFVDKLNEQLEKDKSLLTQ